MKIFFNKNPQAVNKKYLFSEEQRKQNEYMKMLFDQFDADGSGALDIEELTDLYRSNQVPITVDQIERLFGKDALFTLDEFIRINSSKNDLMRYYRAFKQMQRTLLEKANYKRQFMPANFEDLVVDFGTNVERRHIWQNMQAITKEMHFVRNKTETELRGLVYEALEKVQELIKVTDPFKKPLPSATNNLYRRLIEKARNSPSKLAKIRPTKDQSSLVGVDQSHK